MTVFQGNNLSICLIQLWYIIFSIYLVTISAELQRLRQQPKHDGSLRFLVVGDWGREGTYNQTDVAFQMGRYGEKLDIDFVLSTGDNFYNNGLIAVSDPAFKTSFTDIYTAKSLQRPWYTVLGNHDYRGNVKAQLNPVLRKIDSRWLCLRSYILNAEFAEFFFLDTTPFVDVYFDDPLDHDYDWRDIHPRKTYLASLLKDLEQELRGSTADWKIVVGHHAIRSVGHHGDTPELVDRLLPILKAHNVDMYVNGHDHCLEHITCIDNYDSPIHFLTSGGGSKAWRADEKDHNQCAVNFFYDGQGFMSMQLTKNDAEIIFYDINGRVLHQFNHSKKPVSAM